MLIEIPDAELLNVLSNLLGTVTADSITLPAEKPYEPSTQVLRLNNEINRMLDANRTERIGQREHQKTLRVDITSSARCCVLPSFHEARGTDQKL